MGKKVYMLVGIKLPEDMTKDRLREYVRTAIQCERGRYLPEEEFFHINTKKLSVRYINDDIKHLMLCGLRYKNKTFVKGN